MTRNVGGMLIGIGLIGLVFMGPQTAWGWIGVVPLATALLGWCPPYAAFGINTCAGTTRD